MSPFYLIIIPNFKNLLRVVGRIMKKIYIKLFFCFFILLFTNQLLIGGNTGKIKGQILDKKNDEGLTGVNVVVINTDYGAATDNDGYYFINNIPPGTYTLKLMMIGYKSVQIENVIVHTDLSTELNYFMESQVLKGETVTVTAERFVVKKDVTNKLSIVSGDDISEKIPVSSINDVLATQAGFVEDKGGGLHLRGGRDDEVAYYIDGVLVEDPIGGGLGTGIDINAISELSVMTGGFNAEYGDAMSGIINVTTKDGGNIYQGKFQYESGMLNASPYHEKDWALDRDKVKNMTEEEQAEYRDKVRYYESVNDSVGISRYEHVSVINEDEVEDKILVPILGKFSGSFSGPVPFFKNLNFFTSGFHKNSDSYLPNGYQIENQIFGKLSWNISEAIKLRVSNKYTSQYAKYYDHYYKYIPATHNDPSDSLNYNTNLLGERALNVDKTNRQAIFWSHSLSKSTFYTINLSRTYKLDERYIPGKEVPTDEETGQLIDSLANYTKMTYIFGTSSEFRGGDDRDWHDENTTVYNAKFDITSQINNHHQFKIGVDYKQFELNRHNYRDPWPGAFRHRLEFYSESPWEGATYIQDKMEFDFMTLNLGVRLDIVNLNATCWEDPGDIQETVDSQFQFKDREDVPTRYQISPRIGLAHPVTEKLVFHFSYGHFFQNPDYYDIYRNDNSLYNLEESDVILGNPGLEPQKTVAFEVGGKYKITKNVYIDFSGFYKDITNLTSTQYYNRQPYSYTIYINEDYGRIKGFDFTLKKKYNNYFSGNLNYTYSVAKGSGSSPYSGYYYREEDSFLRPKRENYLDFDRTHDFSANIDIRFPGNFGKGFTHLFANFGINILYQMASGLPYTPSYDGSISLETNSERKEFASTLDVKMDKKISLGKLNLVVYSKITNLLDRLNTNYVWSETGEPWDAGPSTYYSKDRQMNPENVGPRRDIRFGMYIKF